MTPKQKADLEKRLEQWWLNMTPAQEERILHWVFDFGEFHDRAVRSWLSQSWAWITGNL